jgi:hypothetical protein
LLGVDYLDFYKASQQLVAGNDPYTIQRYVTSPIPAMVNAPLTALPFSQARIVVMLLSLGCVVGSWLLIQQRLGLTTRAAGGWAIFAAGLVIVLISYPFYFLFDRGNIDAFVLFFMCAGLWLAAAANPGGRAGAVLKSLAAGLLIAIAIAFKLYPVLLLVPLVAARRWRILLLTLVGLGMLVLAAPELWQSFVTGRMLTRGIAFVYRENGSLANTLYFAGWQLDNWLLNGQVYYRLWLRSFGLPVYTILFAATALADLLTMRRMETRQALARTVLYFPFMIAVPQLAYHYEFVLLIPIILVTGFLWQSASRREGAILIVMAVGLVLSQLQVVALRKLTGWVFPDFLPGIGLALILFTITAYKLQTVPWRTVLRRQPAAVTPHP